MISLKTRTRYAIVGSDFSAQEPRCLTHMCGDPELRKTFEEDRDPYATLCAPAFHMDYWDCMEHHQDGTPNPEGKKMRSKGKVLMLGTMYGMGASKMAESMKLPLDQCKEVLKEFYTKFSSIKKFSDESEQMAKDLGYVTDYLGRRRHLPDSNLKEIEVGAMRNVPTNASVFPTIDRASSSVRILDKDTTEAWQRKWDDNPNKGRFGVKESFKKEMKSCGIDFKDNGGFISKTKTQCVNARIQGSAASLTKKAMVAIRNNKELTDLGFRLLIPVHDELLGECPIENADRVAELLTKTMIDAAKPEISIKFKCDPYIASHWYADEVSNELYKEYNAIRRKDTVDEDTEAIKKICLKYPEISEDIVKRMCLGEFDTLSEVI